MYRHTILPTYLLSWVLLLILSLIWGSSFILIKKSLEIYSPIQVGSLRIVFAYIVIFPIVLYRIKQIPKKKRKLLLLCGLLGNLFPAYLFAIAQTRISSSITGILNALTPLFTMIVAKIGFGTKFGIYQSLGLIMGFIGSILLIFLRQDMKSLGHINYYALLIILATIFYGINTNIIKVHLSEMKPLHIAGGALFLIGPIATIYLFTTNFVFVTLSHKQAWQALIYLFILGAIGTSFAFIIFNKLLKITSPIFAVSVTYIVPIVAVLWGIIDDEEFYTIHLLAMTLIIVGVYLTNR